MSIKNTTGNAFSAKEMEANSETTDERTYENTALLGESYNW